MLLCPKCNQPTMWMDGTVERCICGWWNDTTRPIRVKSEQKVYDALDLQEIKREVQAISDACPHSTRWFDKPKKSLEEQKIAQRKATDKWRKKYPDKVKADRDRTHHGYKSIGAIKRVSSKPVNTPTKTRRHTHEKASAL